MVELVLDLAGYVPERRLAELVALQPSAGDGAFLRAMARRLVESCERHGIPLSGAGRSIQAFEIDPEAVERAVEVVRLTLVSLNVATATAVNGRERHLPKCRVLLVRDLASPVACILCLPCRLLLRH